MTQLVNGIYLPDRDKHFADQILQNPLYKGKGTYQYTKLMSSLEACKRRGFAIDIGANVGLWARVLSYEFDHVVAIEPLPENVECLALNATNNNVEIVHSAISQNKGMLSLKYDDGVASSHVVPYEDRDVEVECKPLDDFGYLDVDYIKIDAEGYEDNIVRSGERTIRTCKPVIVIEQKKKRLVRYGLDKHQPTVRLLESWGAHEVWAKSGDHCLIWE